MSAAEYNFANPPSDSPQWLELAQGVFNSQAARWDAEDCGGGLRWQIFTWNNGYDYKNTPSNGGFFNLAARLGAYTGNETYFDWANKTWNWMESVGLIGDDFNIYDGTSIGDKCTTLDHTEWTYTAGMMLHGSAVMWNHSTSATWRNRTEGIWNASKTNFFIEQDSGAYIMQEICEPSHNCNTDQLSFKAYLSRFAIASTKVAPWLYELIFPYLQDSALAAAEQCSGGSDGVTCGLQWTMNKTWDGTYGVGQQMAALEVIQSLLSKDVAGPVTAANGGTSVGDPSAGTDGEGESAAPLPAISTADRAGAGILTVLACLGTLAGG